MQVLTDTLATRINVNEHTFDILDRAGVPQQLPYDASWVPAPSAPGHQSSA
jgi:hypothetical protein